MSRTWSSQGVQGQDIGEGEREFVGFLESSEESASFYESKC